MMIISCEFLHVFFDVITSIIIHLNPINSQCYELNDKLLKSGM